MALPVLLLCFALIPSLPTWNKLWPSRVGGALVLLFGMLVSRITQLAKDDVIEDGQATCLAVDGHRLTLPPRLAVLVRQLRDQDEPRWILGRLATSAPWLFPGQSPARPALADIRTAVQGVSDQTIRLVLEQLGKEGRVRADGTGRSATWTQTNIALSE